jgi:hypothetical protein
MHLGVSRPQGKPWRRWSPGAPAWKRSPISRDFPYLTDVARARAGMIFDHGAALQDHVEILGTAIHRK